MRLQYPNYAYNHPLYSSSMKTYNAASEKNLEIFR